MESPKGTETHSDEEVHDGNSCGSDFTQNVRYVSVTKTLNLRVDSFENIDDVKDNFSKLKVTETNVENLFFTEDAFENAQEFNFKRKDGSNVHMSLHLGVGMQIRVQVLWSAKIISVDVHSWDTINDVKTKFQDKEGTPANQLALFYNRTQLDDLQTLVSYDIKNDSILHAVLLGEDKIKITVRPLVKWDPIEVIVKLCSTVENLKIMIHYMLGFPLEIQNLTFNGVLLKNSQMLADCKIQMGSVISLDSCSRTSKGMQIYVVSLKGKKFPIYVDSSDTVHHLKTVLKSLDGTPMAGQRLVFAGKQLEDHLTLGDYNIQNQVTLHVVLRLCGC